ncbi:MAG: peptidase M14 [Flavobacteriaceae bacterium]|nr:peptidase M14 [Flavobacteriaceae bacterium]
MSTEFKIIDLEQNFEFEENFPKRYVAPAHLHAFFKSNYYKIDWAEIGKSVLGRPIYKLTLGSGSKNALLWTQMHGNETTGTLSILDLLKFFRSGHVVAQTILNEFTLDIIPMLNPDGAELWTRRNAMSIDINRDFLATSSLEMRVLRGIITKKRYDLGFNLHDQRTIFGVGNLKQPATLAFLSPSESENKEVTQTRKKSMGLIADIYREISQILPDKIARFSDEFYPCSVGDNLQKLGIPTLLFEGGHYPKDYYRRKTRKYFSLALLAALYYASTKENWQNGWENYFEIPENSVSFYDIIYRNVQLSDDEKDTIDIAVQYAEQIRMGDEEITFVAKIEDIGDLSFLHGHEEIDARNRRFFSEETQFPKIGMQADFQLDEWFIVNGKKLENWG